MTVPGSLFEPAQLGPVTLRNRIIKAATFEGMSQGGLVSDALVDFHRTMAAGGLGMTTVAYCAVSAEGRGAPNEIVLRAEAVEGLARLAEAVHAEGAAVSAQIGHAGPVAQSRLTRARALSASSGWSPLATRYHAMTVDEIHRVTRDFAAGAKVVADAGFDAVEIHMGHHYLLNAFLSPKFNRRTDGYGTTPANRVLLCREVAAAVREAVGDRVAVTAKFEMVDGVPGGLEVDDSVEMAALLASDGVLDSMQLTGGGSLANPMFLFRGDVPRKEFAATLPPAMRLGFAVIGRRFMPEYPYEEAYFLPMARRFLAEVDVPLTLLGGLSQRATMDAAIAEGFSFVALGRALLHDPSLPSKMQAAELTGSACTHCNKCMPTIYTGTHCVLVDPQDRPGRRLMTITGPSHRSYD